jgi:hypothetical protein
MIAIIVSGVSNLRSVQVAFLQRIPVSGWDWLERPFQMFPVQLWQHARLVARCHA